MFKPKAKKESVAKAIELSAQLEASQRPPTFLELCETQNAAAIKDFASKCAESIYNSINTP